MVVTELSLTGAGLPDLLDRLRRLLPGLSGKYHVKSLALFGSFVRQEQTPESDLDILVDFDEPPSLLEFVRLETLLTESLGVKVDLVMKAALRPAIGNRILQELVPV